MSGLNYGSHNLDSLVRTRCLKTNSHNITTVNTSMSVFDTKTNPAICVFPWVHEYRNINGKTAPCCQGNELRDDESLSVIRQEMLNGIKPRACNTCYKKEQENSLSPRILETVNWIKKFGEPDVNEPMLQYADVRYDPTCNLKCKICGPELSTLWQKEKKVSWPINSANKNYLNSINKKNLKKIYLAGGEPTFIRGYLEFLEDLIVVNRDCEVVINTNLKKLPIRWKEIIQKIKNLTIVCSCDSIDTLGTYVRYPLGWTEFEENVKFVSEHANFLQFNLVASNLTAHKLYETCHWMKQYSDNINLIILTEPESMSERAVPLKHRKTYLENIQRLRNFPVSVHYATNFRKQVQYLLDKYTNSTYDASLHKTLTDEITEQDSHRTLKLQEVDAFLYDWIYR